MTAEKRDFDKEAAAWDEKPARVRLAQSVGNAIKEQVELNSHMNLLDFGCGTGLLTMQLLPHVGSVTGVDSSMGMLEQFKAKFSGPGHSQVSCLPLDIEKGGQLTGKFDLITSSMTLHHIRNIENLFNQFYQATTPGGHLCIADLDSEDGQFHGDNTGVFHFGFDRNSLREVFARAGFIDIHDVTAAEMEKTIDNEEKKFSIFLMTGRKPL
ncbi:MAG: class I SAM-dependent DNA methyltransferase [Candidatus Rifleibacteriota bacterium]